MNSMKTTLLLAALTGLFLAVGQYLGGQHGMVMAFGFAMVSNLIAYWFSDKIVLMMMKAQALAESDSPELFRTVRELARRGGIPMPKLYITPDRTPNAFATGRSPSHAAVCVTSGLLELLGRDEVEGVLSHEVSHIKNRDTLISTVAATLAGAISMLVEMFYWASAFGRSADRREGGNPLAAILLMILAPLAAAIIQMAISRSREYVADASGARITGDPEKLARALEKLDEAAHAIPMRDVKPATAHMFIVSPLAGGRRRGSSFLNLFSTHPPVEERVRRLREMRRGGIVS